MHAPRSAGSPSRAVPVLLSAVVALTLTVAGCSSAQEADDPATTASTASATPAAPASSTPAPSPGATEAADPAQTAADPAPEAADPAQTAADPAPEAADAAQTRPVSLSLQFGDLEVRATVEDSAAARSLLAQLPTTLDFGDYGGQEKIATLPGPLDLSGAPDRAAAPAGTLGYYAPDQGLVLYYESVGAYPGIVPLGVFDDPEALRNADDGPVEVRIP